MKRDMSEMDLLYSETKHIETNVDRRGRRQGEKTCWRYSLLVLRGVSGVA